MERIYVMIAVHAMKENMLKQLIGLKKCLLPYAQQITRVFL